MSRKNSLGAGEEQKCQVQFERRHFLFLLWAFVWAMRTVDASLPLPPCDPAGKNHSSVTARQKMAVPLQILFVATSQLVANWFYCKEGCGRRYSVLSLMVRHESTSALPWFSCQFSSHCAQCSDCGRGSSHLCWGEGQRTGCVILCHGCCM